MIYLVGGYCFCVRTSRGGVAKMRAHSCRGEGVKKGQKTACALLECPLCELSSLIGIYAITTVAIDSNFLEYFGWES